MAARVFSRAWRKTRAALAKARLKLKGKNRPAARERIREILAPKIDKQQVDARLLSLSILQGAQKTEAIAAMIEWLKRDGAYAYRLKGNGFDFKAIDFKNAGFSRKNLEDLGFREKELGELFPKPKRQSASGKVLSLKKQ